MKDHSILHMDQDMHANARILDSHGDVYTTVEGKLITVMDKMRQLASCIALPYGDERTVQIVIDTPVYNHSPDPGKVLGVFNLDPKVGPIEVPCFEHDCLLERYGTPCPICQWGEGGAFFPMEEMFILNGEVSHEAQYLKRVFDYFPYGIMTMGRYPDATQYSGSLTPFLYMMGYTCMENAICAMRDNIFLHPYNGQFSDMHMEGETKVYSVSDAFPFWTTSIVVHPFGVPEEMLETAF